MLTFVNVLKSSKSKVFSGFYITKIFMAVLPLGMCFNRSDALQNAFTEHRKGNMRGVCMAERGEEL